MAGARTTATKGCAVLGRHSRGRHAGWATTCAERPAASVRRAPGNGRPPTSTPERWTIGIGTTRRRSSCRPIQMPPPMSATVRLGAGAAALAPRASIRPNDRRNGPVVVVARATAAVCAVVPTAQTAGARTNGTAGKPAPGIPAGRPATSRAWNTRAPGRLASTTAVSGRRVAPTATMTTTRTRCRGRSARWRS